MVEAHCKFLAWYARVVSDPLVPLSELVDPPVASHRLDRTNDDCILKKYGIIFAVWDYLRRSPRREAVEARNFWVTRLAFGERRAPQCTAN